MNNASNYYAARKSRILGDFDSQVKYVNPVLVRYFGAEQIDPIVAEVRSEYEALIPQLPYIGGKQPFTQFVISTGLWLAIFHIARRRDKSLEEVGNLTYEIGREFLRAYPRFLTRLLGVGTFSSYHVSRLRNRALESQKRTYPEDYVYYFIEGDGQTFDYGVDYIECASCKFLAKHGASEFAQYLCPVDILYSDALGWGLTRTTTLAQGGSKCDFRFKKGGRTNVVVPDSMRSVVAGRSKS